MKTIIRRSAIAVLVVLALLAFVIYSRAIWLLGVTRGQMDCVGVAARPAVRGPAPAPVARDAGWVWGDAGRTREHPPAPRPTVIRPADPRPWEHWTGRPVPAPERDAR